ncbi:MAG: hypothetical protein WDW38_009627 [Sanguina aurantia]
MEDTRQAWDGSSRGTSPTQLTDLTSGLLRDLTAAAAAAAPHPAAPRAAAAGAEVLSEVEALLLHMGITPGRGCIVGEGLAEVELGVFVNGVQIALELSGNADGSSKVLSLKADPKKFAEQRMKDSILKAHGWTVVELPLGQWLSAKDNHARQHLLLEVLKAVMAEKEEQHKHSGGCCGGKH